MLINLRVGSEVTARVAQSVERSAVNRKVGGSNPPVSDIFCQPIRQLFVSVKPGIPANMIRIIYINGLITKMDIQLKSGPSWRICENFFFSVKCTLKE